MRKVVCLGPGPIFKGGISNYNVSLAKAINEEPETEVHIISWTEQYPRIIPRKYKDEVSKKKFYVEPHILDFTKFLEFFIPCL